jgi:hypothetical protein
MSDRIKYLEEKVLFVLEKHPKTRNDDALLTFTIIWEYSNKSIKEIDGKTYVSTEALKWCREDAVKRVRAKIQNERNQFLPTDPLVRKKRRISEETWRSWAFNE